MVQCWSPNWNEPHTASGTPRFGILTNPYPNRLGEPPFQYGDCFFGVFFQSRTRSAFSHQKLRQSQRQRRMMPTRRTSKEEAAAATAGRHASSVTTASNSSSCCLLFSLCPPPSRLLVSSVIAPDPDNDDNDDDDPVSAASTATTTAARVCRLRDWALHFPSIISPSSLSLWMSSSSSQPRLRMPPHRCRHDRQRPPTVRPHSR
jgi:hypothetical protein